MTRSAGGLASRQAKRLGRASHGLDHELDVLVEVDPEVGRARDDVLAVHPAAKALSFIFFRTERASTSWTLRGGAPAPWR